jgi:hypothetical protein
MTIESVAKKPRLRTAAINRPFRIFFRTRRMAKFVKLFDLKDSDRIIDIGGLEFNWNLIDIKPHILMVNVHGPIFDREKRKAVHGDGRALTYPDMSFDIAYSNSVIEHVGGWDQVRRFANEVRRMAPRYYVQTPNKWFFYETHMLGFFVHWLPFRIARRLMRNFTIWGLINRPSQAQCDAHLQSVNLLTERQMRELFPDADIIRERFLGMTKSLIAAKR